VKRIDLPRPRLDARDLQVVIAIGAEGTTAAAADVLHLTQSAVSRALAVAEDHAGAPLFERTPRGLVPTPAGATLLEEGPKLLAELAALERRLRAPRPQPRKVRLAAECFMAYPLLAEVVLRLRRSAPELRLEMPIEHGERAVGATVEGALDAAMVTSRPPRGMARHDLFEDELCFVVGRDHPLASRGALRPRDLTEHTLLAPNARTDDAWFMRQVFGSRRPRLRVQRLPITEAMLQLARAGVGVALLSEWVVAPHLAAPQSGLRMLRLKKGPLRRKWRLIHRPDLASIAPLLVDAILGARPVTAPALR